MERKAARMNFSRSSAHSPYMEWAKLHSAARYTLSASGIASYPLVELGVSADQLEINGPNAYGYEPLISAIAARYGVASECVFTTAGTSLANHLALAATTESGDEVLVEQPTYELLLNTARYLGLELRRFQRPAARSFQPDFTDLGRQLSKKTKLVMVTNLHNPSGALLSSESLKQIGDLARRVGARVLVDEVYLEMAFEERPATAFHLDPERFLVTNSLTKAYGLSGLRCGWVLAAPEIIQRMWRINDLHAATPVFPGEQLSVIAFQKLDQIAARAKSLLGTNRRRLQQFLESRTDLECFFPPYGTIAFPRLKSGDIEGLCSLLLDGFQTTVVPGNFFESPDHFRIGVGGEVDPIKASLERLAQGLDAYSAKLV
jgi:aspartate/methionine/tyrosine aminotransferase